MILNTQHTSLEPLRIKNHFYDIIIIIIIYDMLIASQYIAFIRNTAHTNPTL